MQQAHAANEVSTDKSTLYGMAALVRLIYEGKDISPIWDELFSRVNADQTDAAAFLDLSIILLTVGQKDKADLSQKAALEISRNFEVRHGRGTGPRVLVFMTAGDFMANTPIDFLVENSDATLLLHYVDANTENLDDIPAHDVAFVAVGKFEANLPVLKNLERLLSRWRGPILNNAPRRIMALTRDEVAQSFAGEPLILAPPTVRATYESLQNLATGHTELDALLADQNYPIIVRPVGTHAGQGMEKISSREELAVLFDAAGGTRNTTSRLSSNIRVRMENTVSNGSPSSTGKPSPATSRFPIIGWFTI